jgi:phosphoglycolate phosphatase-like HAD superfamily hydrolase
MSEGIVIGFDFDGTLVDSREAVRHALSETLPEFLDPQQAWSVDDVFHLSLDALRSRYRFRDNGAFFAFRRAFVKRFDNEHYKKVQPIEHAVDLLQNLKARYGSSRLFVLTNRRQESAAQIANALNFERFFAFITSVIPDGTENPKIVALSKALGRYETPYWSAYVGDHPKDAEAATRNGSTAILFDPSVMPKNPPKGAIVIDVLTDVLKIVEENREP